MYVWVSWWWWWSQSRGERVKLFGQLLTTISCAVNFKRSLDTVKEVSRLLVKGAPLEPIGGYTVYPLHLAISGSCTDLLSLLLGAGAPLTSTSGGLGLLEQAWLSPDVTTNAATVVTSVRMVTRPFFLHDCRV